MALNKTAASAASAAPEFETEDQEAVAFADEYMAATTEKAIEAAQAPVVVAPQAVAVAKPATSMMGLMEYKDAMPPLEFGVLPRVVASNGSFMDSDKRVIGSEIKLELLSWNDTYIVSPGDSSERAKKVTGFSRDGKTIDRSGETVPEYLRMLREEGGFPKAEIKNYVELIGFLTETNGKGTDLLGGMVLISLAPQSRKRFQAYQLERAVKARQGRLPEGPAVLTLACEVSTWNGNSFTQIKIA